MSERGYVPPYTITDKIVNLIKEKLLQSASEAGIDWDLHSSNNFEWVVIE